MISSAATPATGEPRKPRGESPQASWVCRPTASRRCQIAGTSSIRIQWYWMFCRSVMSALFRPKSVEMPPRTRSCSALEQGAVAADAEHEELVVELLGLQGAGLAAVEPGLALRVEAPPAEPAAQVAAVDGGEAAVGVDVLDPRADVERVVVLLGLLVGVQRLAVAERPLALAALGPGTAGCGRGRRESGTASRWSCARVSSGGRGEDARIAEDPPDTVVEVYASARAPCWSAGRSGGVLGHTHHAAGTTEVHVAASHEVRRRCSGHAEKSHGSDVDPTNPNLVW